MEPVARVGIGERRGGDGNKRSRLRNDAGTRSGDSRDQGRCDEVRLGHHPPLLALRVKLRRHSTRAVCRVSWFVSMPVPLRLAFLGCGFITHVHSRHLRSLKADVVTSYASRDKARAEAFCRRYRGTTAYSSYSAAIADPNIDAIVVAVPPRFHLDLTLQALAAGKHVLVEKPAYLRRRLPRRNRCAQQGRPRRLRG